MITADPDQIVFMHWLIWVYTGYKCIRVGFPAATLTMFVTLNTTLYYINTWINRLLKGPNSSMISCKKYNICMHFIENFLLVFSNLNIASIYVVVVFEQKKRIQKN